LPSQSSIFVVFRGSTSITDWVNNLDAVLTTYPKCSGCEVHKGFYDAQQSVWPQILDQVQALRAKFPAYTTVVTGHSLGAAMATLTTLELLDKGVNNIRMFNFGSPRVGNTNFASYASTKMVDRHRNTHHKDMVPHVPMHERFTHISGEYYEDDAGLHECSGYEDPNCSYQWHITSIDDHMHYLGLYVGCDAVSQM
jgi:predicted lipase